MRRFILTFVFIILTSNIAVANGDPNMQLSHNDTEVEGQICYTNCPNKYDASVTEIFDKTNESDTYTDSNSDDGKQ